MERQYLTLDEIHALLAGLLDRVDEVCRAEGIRYFLSGGTLLGAARHGGFIPVGRRRRPDDAPAGVRALSRGRARAAFSGRYELAFPGRTDGYALSVDPRPRPRNRRGGRRGRSTRGRPRCFWTSSPSTRCRRTRGWRRRSSRKSARATRCFACARKKAFLPGERLQWLKRPLMALTRARGPERYALSLCRGGRPPLLREGPLRRRPA